MVPDGTTTKIFYYYLDDNDDDPKRSKRASSTQYGYRINETKTQVLSQTFVHGKIKNEIRQRNRESS